MTENRPSQDRIDRVQAVVESNTGQLVEFFSEWGGWFAFKNDAGDVCVVCDNILTGKVQADKPTKTVLQHLGLM